MKKQERLKKNQERLKICLYEEFMKKREQLEIRLEDVTERIREKKKSLEGFRRNWNRET